MSRLGTISRSLCAALGLAAPAGAQMLTGGTLTMPSHGFASTGGTALSGPGFSGTGALGVVSSAMLAGGPLSLVSGPMGARPFARLDLERLHAFPTPFRKSSGHSRITFRGATTHTRVRVYTLSGWLVRTLEKHDAGTEDLVWAPVVNFAGEPLASGVYVYFAEGERGASKSGKLMIIK